jgi:hypothetical protein
VRGVGFGAISGWRLILSEGRKRTEHVKKVNKDGHEI